MSHVPSSRPPSPHHDIHSLPPSPPHTPSPTDIDSGVFFAESPTRTPSPRLPVAEHAAPKPTLLHRIFGVFIRAYEAYSLRQELGKELRLSDKAKKAIQSFNLEQLQALKDVRQQRRIDYGQVLMTCPRVFKTVLGSEDMDAATGVLQQLTLSRSKAGNTEAQLEILQRACILDHPKASLKDKIEAHRELKILMLRNPSLSPDLDHFVQNKVQQAMTPQKGNEKLACAYMHRILHAAQSEKELRAVGAFDMDLALHTAVIDQTLPDFLSPRDQLQFYCALRKEPAISEGLSPCCQLLARLGQKQDAQKRFRQVEKDLKSVEAALNAITVVRAVTHPKVELDVLTKIAGGLKTVLQEATSPVKATLAAAHELRITDKKKIAEVTEQVDGMHHLQCQQLSLEHQKTLASLLLRYPGFIQVAQQVRAIALHPEKFTSADEHTVALAGLATEIAQQSELSHSEAKFLKSMFVETPIMRYCQHKNTQDLENVVARLALVDAQGHTKTGGSRISPAGTPLGHPEFGLRCQLVPCTRSDPVILYLLVEPDGQTLPFDVPMPQIARQGQAPRNLTQNEFTDFSQAVKTSSSLQQLETRDPELAAVVEPWLSHATKLYGQAIDRIQRIEQNTLQAAQTTHELLSQLKTDPGRIYKRPVTGKLALTVKAPHAKESCTTISSKTLKHLEHQCYQNNKIQPGHYEVSLPDLQDELHAITVTVDPTYHDAGVDFCKVSTTVGKRVITSYFARTEQKGSDQELFTKMHEKQFLERHLLSVQSHLLINEETSRPSTPF